MQQIFKITTKQKARMTQHLANIRKILDGKRFNFYYQDYYYYAT